MKVCVCVWIYTCIYSNLCLLNNKIISKREDYYLITTLQQEVTWASTRCHMMTVKFLFLFIHKHKPVVTLNAPRPQALVLKWATCRFKNYVTSHYVNSPGCTDKDIYLCMLYWLLPNWMPYPQSITRQYEALVTVEILLQPNKSKLRRWSRKMYMLMERTMGCGREMLTIKL